MNDSITTTRAITQPPYSHIPDDYRCPFCDLIQRTENLRDYSRLNDIVYQDAWVTALIASHQYPRNAPNIIIVPNTHYENIFDLPPDLAADIQRAAQKIAFALKQAYHCDGISTRQHSEPSGSQDVWHYHLHVTPRFRDDRFYHTIYEKALMPEQERASHAQRVRDALTHQAKV
jgi:histidine triad (HIT) family protein